MKGGIRNVLKRPPEKNERPPSGCITGMPWTEEEDALLCESADNSSKLMAKQLKEVFGTTRTPAAVKRRRAVLRKRGMIRKASETVQPAPRKRRIDAICVGARHFRITWAREELDAYAETLLDDPDSQAYAYCVKVDRVIAIDPDMHTTPEGTLETVLHEAAHVCEGFLGHEIPHKVIDAWANITTAMLVQSGFVDPAELVIAGRELGKLQPVRRTPDD